MTEGVNREKDAGAVTSFIQAKFAVRAGVWFLGAEDRDTVVTNATKKGGGSGKATNQD